MLVKRAGQLTGENNFKIRLNGVESFSFSLVYEEWLLEAENLMFKNF